MRGASSNSCSRPLVTDLDGTLVRADLLWEGLFRILRRRPWHIGGLVLALLKGRTAFKAQVAREADIDPRSLPWNEAVVDFLVAEHRRGRRVWLATAAHRIMAEAVADHLEIFDRVFASSGSDNIKGPRKRTLLLEAAPGGFDYIGDSIADIPLFSAARQGWTVGPAAARLARRAGRGGGKVEPLPSAAPGVPLFPALVRLIRPHQWLKNGLVLLPAIAGHRWLDGQVVVNTLVVFAAFCLVASAAYVLNDLLDVEYDRAHPRKRGRPLASGAVPQPLALFVFPVLLIAGAGLAFMLPIEVAGVLMGYFVLTTLYSIVLKRIALIDILALAVLYNIRMLGGGAAAGIALSYWLVGFTLFLFRLGGDETRYGSTGAARKRKRCDRGPRLSKGGRSIIVTPWDCLQRHSSGCPRPVHGQWRRA